MTVMRAIIMTLCGRTLAVDMSVTKWANKEITFEEHSPTSTRWMAMMLLYIGIVHVLATVTVVRACCFCRSAWRLRSGQTKYKKQEDDTEKLGKLDYKDERADLHDKFALFTVQEIKNALRARHQSTTGIKADLVTRLSRTKPLATRAQVRYMSGLCEQNHELRIDLVSLLSPTNASAWLTAARGHLDRQ